MTPAFNPAEGYGEVIGDGVIAFQQNGAYFDRKGRFLRMVDAAAVMPPAESVVPAPLLAAQGLQTLLREAASAPAGAFVEIGVYQGGSALHLAKIAREQGRKLYLYDTFAGMPFADPDKGDVHKAGEFADTSLEAVKALIPDAVIVPGIFPDSLIAMDPVAFVHADGDQYRTTAAICTAMPPLMVPGGKILFDDYGPLAGATAAVNEHFKDAAVTPEGKALITIGAAIQTPNYAIMPWLQLRALAKEKRGSEVYPASRAMAVAWLME